MEIRSAELFAPFDVGIVRPVELADGTYQHVVAMHGHSARSGGLHLPDCGVLLPCGVSYLGVETNMIPNAAVVSNSGEVSLDVPGMSVIVVPDLPGKGIAVEEAVTVDAATGILVLEPSASDVPVLFIDDEGNTGLPEPYRHQQSALACSDDAD